MANGNSESTAVADTNPPDLMECLKTATPEALSCLAEVLCKGLQVMDSKVLKIIILLHGSKPNFREIIEIIDSIVKSSNHGIDDTCRIINTVTKNVLDSQSNINGLVGQNTINGLTIKEWMGALRNYYLYFSNELMLGVILSLLELAGSWDRRIPQDFNDGLDDILIHLVSNAHRGIPRHLLDEKYCGRLSNAIKRYFHCGDHSKVFTSINLDKDLSNRVLDQSDLSFGAEERLSLVVLEQINYAFFGSLRVREATKFIKRGLATQEPTKPNN
ncbi:MAG: hypothetical protein WCT16_02185 [Candidatus Buchananbacteria bacterium]